MYIHVRTCIIIMLVHIRTKCCDMDLAQLLVTIFSYVIVSVTIFSLIM